MANKPTDEAKRLTWKDKLEQGLPLNPLEETQADADYNYRHRLRDEQEKREFEASKNRGPQKVNEESEK